MGITNRLYFTNLFEIASCSDIFILYFLEGFFILGYVIGDICEQGSHVRHTAINVCRGVNNLTFRNCKLCLLVG